MQGIELSAAELASLDSVIAKMKANPKMALDTIEPEAGRVVTTVVVTAIFLALGADATVSQAIKDVASAAKKVSLNDLLEIRKKAIVKK